MSRMNSSRRRFLGLTAGLCVLPCIPPSFAYAPALVQKPIPRTGELLPVVGLGTARAFDVGLEDAGAMSRLQEVLKIFFQRGGAIIDSSPMYGNAEAVVGALLERMNHDDLFSVTKVWIEGQQAGVKQMRESFALWGKSRIDAMQIHNLLDWEVHLESLKKMKTDRQIRYIGITTYAGYDHAELAGILRKHDEFDFVQLSYNAFNRKAEKTLFPIIRDKEIAVIANRPFQRGALFKATKGKPLPAWASDIQCESWGQVFLKYVISHPQVTCAIPGTSQPKHMRDNMQAQYHEGLLPDRAMRQRMNRYFESLM